MNAKGIEKFKSLVEVGDEVSVSYLKGGESLSYHGIVTEITDSVVWVRNNLNLGFFEALATPAIEDVRLGSIWFYSVKKQDGREIAV